jgi:hypothetical protein
MTVTEYGIGPLRAGMTIREAAAALGGGFAAPAEGANECTWAVIPDAPHGFNVMLEKNRVVRVDVEEGTIATATGLRIGDPIEKIRSAYPDAKIEIQPNAYTDYARDVLVTPSSDPGQHQIIFETDGKTISRFRSGQTPQVGYVEGCS